MAISNVSTYGALQSLLQNMGTVQNSLNNSQEQVSSGYVSQTFDGISPDVQRLTSMNAQLTRISNYQTGNTTIIGQMQTASTVLGQATTIAGSIKSLIQSQISGTLNVSAFNQQIQSQLSSLAAALNTSYGGNYIFGGTNTSSPPVKTPVPANNVVGVPDDSYYQGGDLSPMVRISDSQTLTPGINANDLSFQKIIAGVNQALQASVSGNTAQTLKSAEDLVDSGLQGVISLQSTVNSNILTVQQYNTQSQSIQTYFKSVVSNITSSDVVSLSAKVAQDTSVLQASFATFARISQLSLVSYLK